MKHLLLLLILATVLSTSHALPKFRPGRTIDESFLWENQISEQLDAGNTKEALTTARTFAALADKQLTSKKGEYLVYHEAWLRAQTTLANTLEVNGLIQEQGNVLDTVMQSVKKWPNVLAEGGGGVGVVQAYADKHGNVEWSVWAHRLLLEHGLQEEIMLYCDDDRMFGLTAGEHFEALSKGYEKLGLSAELAALQMLRDKSNVRRKELAPVWTKLSPQILKIRDRANKHALSNNTDGRAESLFEAFTLANNAGLPERFFADGILTYQAGSTFASSGRFHQGIDIIHGNLKYLHRLGRQLASYSVDTHRSLGELYYNMGDYLSALEAFQVYAKLSDLREPLFVNVLMSDDDYYRRLRVMIRTAHCMEMTGDETGATELRNQLLDSVLKENNLNTARQPRKAHNAALATLYHATGRYKEALNYEPRTPRGWWDQSTVSYEDHAMLADCLLHSGNAGRGMVEAFNAEQGFQKYFTIKSPYYVKNLYTMVGSLVQLKKEAKTAKHPILISDHDEQLKRCAKLEYDAAASALADLAAFATERQLIAFQESRLTFSLPVLVGDSELIAKSLLLVKSRVLDLEIRTRQLAGKVAEGDLRKKLAELDTLRDQLRFTRREDATKSHDSTALEMFKRCDELEATLRSAAKDTDTPQGKQEVTPANVTKALQPGDLLLDYIGYQKYVTDGEWARHYGVVVYTHDRAPIFQPLCAKAAIEKALATVSAIAGAKPPDEATTLAALKSLYQELIQPAAKQARSPVKHLYVCAASGLQLVPFDSLAAENGRFLFQQFPVTQIASARDLIHLQTGPVPAGQLVLVGNPAFADTLVPPVAVAAVTVASSEIRGVDSLDLPKRLESLPGTADEVKRVAELWISTEAGRGAQSLVQSLASEDGLLSLSKPPTILHLATHGMYLKDSPGRTSSHLSPMVRSCVFLAGADAGLAGWRSGKPLPSKRDGILTAADASRLNLNGTRLVVLSACDSATGGEARGEGLFGLRRGFALAGAGHIVTTLWPIDDQWTSQIMTHFYEQLLASKPPAEALAEAKRLALEEMRTRSISLTEQVRLLAPFLVGR